MCRKILVLFILFAAGVLNGGSLYAQSQDSLNTQIQDSINAKKVALMCIQAEKEYYLGHYESTILILDNAINIVDSTNADIQYLLAKSNMALSRKKQAQKDVHVFLQISTDSLSPKYEEMALLFMQLESEIGAYQVDRDIAGLVDGGFNEQETWDYAMSTGTLQAFRNYVKFFPNGLHIKQAEAFIEKEEKKLAEPSKLLIEAVKQGNMKRVRELIEMGADVNHVITFKRSHKKALGYAHDLYFETPLYMALYKFDYSMAKYLLENGADPNRFTYRRMYDYKAGGDTRSILESMIIATSESGVHTGKDERLMEFIDLMLDYGLDVNFYNGSPLATAVYYHEKDYSRYKLIRYLLRKGADPKLPGWDNGAASAIDIARNRSDDRLLAVLKDKRYAEIRKAIIKKRIAEVKKYRQKAKAAAKKKKAADKAAQQKQKEADKKQREAEKNQPAPVPEQ